MDAISDVETDWENLSFPILNDHILETNQDEADDDSLKEAKLMEVPKSKGPWNCNFAKNILMYCAVLEGNLNFADIALNQLKVCVGTRDDDKNTFLIIASERGDKDMVQLLLRNSAQVDEQNILGKTALMVAVMREHPEVVSILLENSASPDIDDKFGYTSVLLAAQSLNITTLKLLVKTGDVGKTSNEYRTALHCAAVSIQNTEKGWDVIELLISEGVSCDAIDDSNMTASDILYSKSQEIGNKFKDMVLQASQKVPRRAKNCLT